MMTWITILMEFAMIKAVGTKGKTKQAKAREKEAKVTKMENKEEKDER